jgi:CHAT domain-containing protein
MATEDQVYAHAGQFDILHLSAHGVLDGRNPLFSAIKLAPAADGDPDGRLTVQEIYGLDLNGTNLVVLSACETSLGGQNQGDESIGLTRAFLYAGAPTVITTLWSVQAKSAATLMKSFYRHLHGGETAAFALQYSQIEMLRKDPDSTYHWAAFTLTGDHRGGIEP